MLGAEGPEWKSLLDAIKHLKGFFLHYLELCLETTDSHRQRHIWEDGKNYDGGDDGDGDDGKGEETKRAAKETCGSSEVTGPVQQGGVKGRFFKVLGRFFFPSHFLFATLLAGANERASR